jgi:hypothetical protein
LASGLAGCKHSHTLSTAPRPALYRNKKAYVSFIIFVA